LTKTFPRPDLKILNISWSPDSKYLALAVRDSDELSVLFYDISSGKYISQCPVAKVNDMWPPLIWSPDSSHIAISQIDSPILILDIFSGDVLELVQHGRVLGWSNKFPVSLP
jgi:WD40 repeat protein